MDYRVIVSQKITYRSAGLILNNPA